MKMLLVRARERFLSLVGRDPKPGTVGAVVKKSFRSRPRTPPSLPMRTSSKPVPSLPLAPSSTMRTSSLIPATSSSIPARVFSSRAKTQNLETLAAQKLMEWGPWRHEVVASGVGGARTLGRQESTDQESRQEGKNKKDEKTKRGRGSALTATRESICYETQDRSEETKKK